MYDKNKDNNNYFYSFIHCSNDVCLLVMIVKKNSLNKNKKKIENPKQTNKHYSDIQSSKHQVPVIQSFNHPKEKLDFFIISFFLFGCCYAHLYFK